MNAPNDISRRRFLQASAAAVAASSLAPLPTAEARGLPPGEARGKISKAAANYQNQPRIGFLGKQQCSGCINFRGPSSCVRVKGTISPTGWCRLWEWRIT